MIAIAQEYRQVEKNTPPVKFLLNEMTFKRLISHFVGFQYQSTNPSQLGILPEGS
jgi:hypothetical protein